MCNLAMKVGSSLDNFEESGGSGVPAEVIREG
jgi:hypothetical protein